MFNYGSFPTSIVADARAARFPGREGAGLGPGDDLMKGTGLKSGTLYPLPMRLAGQGLATPSGGSRPVRIAHRATLTGGRRKGADGRGRSRAF
jgi:hypothetical protein